jgi:hypothetical protein
VCQLVQLQVLVHLADMPVLWSCKTDLNQACKSRTYLQITNLSNMLFYHVTLIQTRNKNWVAAHFTPSLIILS